MNAAVRSFDTKLTSLVALLPKGLQRPFEILGMMTSPLVWTSAIIVTAIVSRPVDYTPFLVALAAMPLASIIKFAFKRQRPPTIYAGNMRIKSYSFPSSHSYSAALGCSFLGSLAIPPLAILLGVIALTVGLSRIYVGAHYPSDVLVGLAFGSVIGFGIIAWL